MIPENSKVFIACPAYGGMIHAQTTASIFHAGIALSAANVQSAFATLSHPDIAEVRNVFITIFADSLIEATHILFVDADMRFRPEMILAMLGFDQPVVGCLYRKKEINLGFVGNDFAGGEVIRDGFKKMDDIGFGVTLIKREAIARMTGNDPKLIDRDIDRIAARHLIRNHGLQHMLRPFDKIGPKSEDISFCHRWRECGGEVWASAAFEVGHIGWHDYAGRYQDVMRAQPEPPKF